MFNVCVAEHDGLQLRRLERRRAPVSQSQLIQTLELAAVEQDPFAGVRHQKYRAGHRSGRAIEGERAGVVHN